jgi:hypothetical protein
MSHQLWTVSIKYGLTPNQIYLLDCYRSKIKPLFINETQESDLCKKYGLLNEDYSLTEKAIIILDDFEMFLVKTKKKLAIDILGDDLLEKINEYVKTFPAMRLPSGTLARQSINELKPKFVWFFKTYPNYSWDLVLDAVKYYVMLKEAESFNYMMSSSYFIQKTDARTKASKSELADYCQLILDDPNVLPV